MFKLFNFHPLLLLSSFPWSYPIIFAIIYPKIVWWQSMSKHAKHRREFCLKIWPRLSLESCFVSSCRPLVENSLGCDKFWAFGEIDEPPGLVLMSWSLSHRASFVSGPNILTNLWGFVLSISDPTPPSSKQHSRPKALHLQIWKLCARQIH